MATESPLIHDGAQTVAGADYRNSTNTGTTHSGNAGSPQFQAVRISTAADRTVLLCTANGAVAYGLLQNKPALGEAADVGVFGVSKAIAGATFAAGVKLMTDSSGCLIAYASSSGVIAVGIALEAPTAAGQAFTMFLWGASGPGSIA